jgi:hypothetical protein
VHSVTSGHDSEGHAAQKSAVIRFSPSAPQVLKVSGTARQMSTDTLSHYPAAEIPESFPQLRRADRPPFDQGQAGG